MWHPQPMTRLDVAVIQLDAGTDPKVNVAEAARLADQAAAEGARLIALPEYIQFRGSDDGYRASARPIPGPFSDAFAAVARERKVWILAGSLAESGPQGSRTTGPTTPASCSILRARSPRPTARSTCSISPSRRVRRIASRIG